MENANNTYELKVEKVIPKVPADVFRAIGEGRLFTNCSADHESLQIDFKVGGKYFIQFLQYGMKNQGEFLEIVPNQRIVFTWCQDYDSNPTPDTKVLIELKDLGGKTALTLTHSGFEDAENRDGHEGGWNGGLEDLSQEIATGKLRLSRKVSMPMEKLFELCTNKKMLIDLKKNLKGEFLETSPKKIIFGTPESKVTLLLDTDDEDQNVSWLEVIHDGLNTEAEQKSHRAEWDSLLKKLT